MAIDLPPAIPPQLSTAEQIVKHTRAMQQDAIVLSVGGLELYVTGNRYLSEDELQALAAKAINPSQAIRGIAQAYYERGHLLTTVYYAPQNQRIYVHVVNAALSAIEAPDAIRSYFAGLIGDEDLTISDFEADRVLADLKSKRAGVDYSVSYRVGADPESYTLVLTEKPIQDYDATDIIAEVTNGGNRFLGRYFGSVGIKHRFQHGGEISLMYDGAITQWGDTNQGKSYDSLQLNYNVPTRFGLYGVEASWTEYEREALLLTQLDGGDPISDIPVIGGVLCGPLSLLCEGSSGLGDAGGTPAPAGFTTTPIELIAEIKTAAMTGEQVVYADRRQRFTVAQRLEGVESTIETDNGEMLLDEPHASLELGAKYYRLLRLLTLPSRLTLQVFVESGLTEDDGTLGTSDAEGTVAVGRRTAEYLMFRPKIALKIGEQDKTSLNIDVLAQLTNDDQLPQHQQFVLGGINTMSAFLPGILVGDAGTYSRVSIEGGGWRVLGTKITPAVFVEYGQSWYEDTSTDYDEVRSLGDGGVRVKFEFPWDIDAEVVAAKRLSESNVPEEFVDELEADFFARLRKTF